MNVNKMRAGHTHWDYDGDGRFAKFKAYNRNIKRAARKWWIKQLKKRMDD